MRRLGRPVSAAVCLAGAIAAAVALSTCSRAKKPRERGELSDVEKTAIAAFTSGTISRESPVRVAFHEALATPEQIGAPLEPSPFRFEPRIKGTAVWAAPDRIEFRPAERLPDGEAYAASLDLTALFPKGKAPLPPLRLRVRDHAPVVRRGRRGAAGRRRHRRQAPDARRPADHGRRGGRAGGREGAQGLARRARARGGVGARPGPPHPRLHGRRNRARRGGLDAAPALGRQPDRRVAQGRPRGRPCPA